jgi:hypothetical protein
MPWQVATLIGRNKDRGGEGGEGAKKKLKKESKDEILTASKSEASG